MADKTPGAAGDPDPIPLTLETQKIVPASPGRVFKAWTDPAELQQWWGPANVRCLSAEVDLRVGGRYRIGNQLPGGAIIWIEGTFVHIQEPETLVYTWKLDTGIDAGERVTVRFLPHENGTKVIVRHDRIESPALRDQHREGWLGCLAGLDTYLAANFNRDDAV